MTTPQAEGMPLTSELTVEDVMRQPQEALASLRAQAADKSEVITVWKDGTWKRWLRQDDLLTQKCDPGWLSVIPSDELATARRAVEPGGSESEYAQLLKILYGTDAHGEPRWTPENAPAHMRDEMTAMAKRLLSIVSLATLQPSVPAGWKLVPVEPTEEMYDQADDGYWRAHEEMRSVNVIQGRDADVGTCSAPYSREIWKDMLAASPQPPEDRDHIGDTTTMVTPPHAIAPGREEIAAWVVCSKSGKPLHVFDDLGHAEGFVDGDQNYTITPARVRLLSPAKELSEGEEG